MLGGALHVCSGSVAGDEIISVHVKRGTSCREGTVVGVMELPESHEAVDSPHAHATPVSGIKASHVSGRRVFWVFGIVDGGLPDFCFTFPSGEDVKVGVDGCSLKNDPGPNTLPHGRLPSIGLSGMDPLSLQVGQVGVSGIDGRTGGVVCGSLLGGSGAHSSVDVGYDLVPFVPMEGRGPHIGITCSYRF